MNTDLIDKSIELLEKAIEQLKVNEDLQGRLILALQEN